MPCFQTREVDLADGKTSLVDKTGAKKSISDRADATADETRIQNNVVFFGTSLVLGLGMCWKFYRDWIHKAYVQKSVFHALDVERFCNDIVDLCILLLTILMLGTLIYDPFSGSGEFGAQKIDRNAGEPLTGERKEDASSERELNKYNCMGLPCESLVRVGWKLGAGINRFWQKTNVFPGEKGGFMAGGFVPRPAALAMAGLLFATKTFITEEMVLGRDLSLTTLRKYDGCIASHSISSEHQHKFAVSRFFREKPLGCYGVNETYNGIFKGYTRTEIYPDTVTESDSFENTFGVAGEKKECMYQCAKWKAVSVETLVSNMGIIFTGATMIVKFTVMVSGYCGFSRVDEDTEPQTMMRLFDMLKYCEEKTDGKFFHRSAFLCAIQLFLIAAVPYFIAPHFAVDGAYTVDYYLNRTVWTSTNYVLLFRLWNPYYWRPLVCTVKMWETGKDTFYVADRLDQTATKVDYDLHQWLHLPTDEKMKLLVRYAQRLTVRDIKDFRALSKEDKPKIQIRVTNPEVIQTEKEGNTLKIPIGSKGTLKTSGTSEGTVLVDWDNICSDVECARVTLLEDDENVDKSISRLESEAQKEQSSWSHLKVKMKRMKTSGTNVTWADVRKKHIDKSTNEQVTLSDCLMPCCFCCLKKADRQNFEVDKQDVEAQTS